MERARLSRYGVLSVTGEDSRAFLHAQLTNDVANLPADRAALAGWCSAKGRLLASLLVVPAPQGFLLQLARDIAPGMAKRLGLFVLRAKVRIADESDSWNQIGIWRTDPGGSDVVWDGECVTVRVGEGRFLQLSRGSSPEATRNETDWSLAQIHAGQPLITAATQDLFVPQMVNYEQIGAVDFRKGCYPGQEIVARAQYRGQVKRRMVRLQAPDGAALQPGQEFQGGVVVDSAGGEVLAVLPVPG